MVGMELEEILRSGKAEKKMREIISQQGGDPKIMPEDIDVGEHTHDVKSAHSGRVFWIDNNALVEVARAAWAPKDREASVILHKKLGDSVKKGEPLFSIYASKARKIDRAVDMLEEIRVYGVAEKGEMLIHRVKEVPLAKKAFILER